MENYEHWRKTKEQQKKENYEMKTWIKKEQMQKSIMCWLNVLMNIHRKYILAKIGLDWRMFFLQVFKNKQQV